MSKSNHHPVGKDRILATAERLFLERGYKAVSIRDIAHACHVTNAALYYYFPSKEALFREVLRQHILRLAQALQQAQENTPGPPKAQLTAMVQVYAHWVLTKRASFFAVRRDLFALAQQAASQGERRPFRDLVAMLTAPFENVLQQAVAQGHLRPPPGKAPLSNILLGMLHGMLHDEGNPPSVTAEDAAQWVVEVFWRGLTPS